MFYTIFLHELYLSFFSPYFDISNFKGKLHIAGFLFATEVSLLAILIYLLADLFYLYYDDIYIKQQLIYNFIAVLRFKYTYLKKSYLHKNKYG